MSIDRPPESQPPAPRRKHILDPRVVLVIALVIGGLAAHYVDWRMAFEAFISVLALFTPRPTD